ncbi:MAG: acyl-CoA thioesterase [Proteobacteria bacterium]|nr:acyl-CoA thioesterase [Pseudomonadota bacterium]MBU4011416.1 acyl-CoA thioesterase [Pseudomonadota bacterium]
MTEFKFSISLKVRIDDVNYGNHVGYQIYFLYFQQARIAYLAQFGYSELNINGYGMIISEANCKYKQELFFGDDIIIECRVSELKSKMFIMDYRISKANKVCASGYTTNMCFDYNKKKVVSLSQEFIDKIKEFEGVEYK